MRIALLVGLVILAIPHLGLANFAAWDISKEGEEANKWLTKESAHFVITYPQLNTVMADKALNIAERVHSELVPFFGQAPQTKTQMALVDDFDFSNGWATFFPFAQIRLFASPPDRISGLEVNDDWLHTLIRHEYVHILQLEMERGYPKGLRNIFGRVFFSFPHAITPSFMLEGLATYLETNHELGYGRLQGSFYAMQMRTEVAAKRLKSLGDVSAPLRDWPLGMQYLYGSYFYQFLAQTYGEQAIKDYLYKYSGQGLPAIMQNYSMSYVVGKNFEQLWREYQQWLNNKFSIDIDLLSDSPLQGEVLNFEKMQLALFKDVSNSQGNAFYFIDNNGEDKPRLSVYIDDKKSMLVDAKGVLSFDINQQQEIIASRMVNWKDGRSWADVYLLEQDALLRPQWLALSKKSRLRNVRWLNNNLIIATRKEQGISELVLLDKQGNSRSLWRGQDETTVLGDFDIAAVGDYLVVSIKRALQGWNLERIDLAYKDASSRQSVHNVVIKSWQKITNTKAIENSPQVLPDGRILYSADYDGIYNLYILEADYLSYDLKQDRSAKLTSSPKVIQVTKMLSGAFEPKYISFDETEGKSEQIIFQAYTADGFEFRKIDLANKALSELETFTLADKQGQYNYPLPYTLDVKKTSAQSYSPWSSLTPKWWLPYFGSTVESSQVGVSVGGVDTLARHNYSLQLGFDSEHEIADVTAVYTYGNRYQVAFQRSHEFVDVVADSKPEFIIEQDRWIFSRNNIVNSIEDQLSLNAAILVEREGTIERKGLVDVPCTDGIGKGHKSCEKTLAGLGLQFDNREAYLNSPGFSSGRYLDLVYESNDVMTGLSDSDYHGGILQGQWQEIFDLPGRRSLSLQVLAARSGKDNEALTIGGENRLSELSLFGRDDFALRGYASSVQGGNNMNVNRLNFNQWLGRIDKGWGIWPIAAGDYSANMFVDYGSAWQSGDSPHYLTGVGVDFNIEVLAFYNLIMPIRLSIARGLDDKLGEDRVSIGISLPY